MSVLLRLPAAKRYFTTFTLLRHLCGTYPVASEKFFVGHVGYFRLHSFGTRDKAVLKAWDNGRRNLCCQHWKRTLFVGSRAGREDMNPLGNGSFCEKQTPFLSAQIQCSGAIADQLTEALMCFGANSISIEDAGSEELVEQRILYLQYASFMLTMYAVKLLNLETSSWENCWCSQKSTMPMDMFQPTQVTDGLWVIPEWRAPPDPQAINIILDLGVAFGTGEHPTTRLCLLFLREFVNGGDHVLDYGTGSGILSIAALKMGAAKAVGVDIDPMAVSSANRNAALNSFGTDKMQVFLASNDGNNPLSSVAASKEITKGHPVAATSNTGPVEYDIVVANILLNPLLELASQIMGYVKPGGVVGLSGIILDQVPQVQECYSHFLENMIVSQADGWAFIKGRKRLLQ